VIEPMIIAKYLELLQKHVLFCEKAI